MPVNWPGPLAPDICSPLGPKTNSGTVPAEPLTDANRGTRLDCTVQRAMFNPASAKKLSWNPGPACTAGGGTDVGPATDGVTGAGAKAGVVGATGAGATAGATGKAGAETAGVAVVFPGLVTSKGGGSTIAGICWAAGCV